LVQTNTENRNLKIKKIKTHHIADLFAIKEGAAQLTGPNSTILRLAISANILKKFSNKLRNEVKIIQYSVF
jgi:hypothetical protein